MGELDRNRRLTMGVGDLIGTTAASVDLLSGELLEVSTYYPNGARETLRTNAGIAVPLEPMGFTGKEADEDVGLVYFGERYLLARLGRWASPDPLHVHASGGGEALNSYHYVSGSLLQARDPLGLDGCGEPGEDACTGDTSASMSGGRPDAPDAAGADAIRARDAAADLGEAWALSWDLAESLNARGETAERWSDPSRSASLDASGVSWDSESERFVGLAMTAFETDCETNAFVEHASSASSTHFWARVAAQIGMMAASVAAEATVAVAAESTALLRLALSRGVPRGFRSPEAWRSFARTMRNSLGDLGLGDATPIMQGSSVTGRSFRTGEAFDVERISDFDVALASPDLLSRARRAGIGLRSRGTRTGPLSGDDLTSLGLDTLARELSERAGRPVNFMIYGSVEAAVERSPSIIFPALAE